MTTNTISTYLNAQIVLGTGNYGNSLTISQSGTLAAATFAVYGGLLHSNNEVQNAGLVTAGIVALELEAGGTITNTGSIYGGVAGIVLGFSGSLNNSGTISGGNTSYASGHAAVFIGASGSTALNAGQVQNSGAIIGPDIGLDIINANAANSGEIYGGIIGAVLLAGSVGNTGDISSGAFGLYMTGGTLNNAGSISAGNIAVDVLAGALTNDSTGIITAGSFGVVLRPTAGPVTFTNNGAVSGGITGVYLSASTLVNSGKITNSEFGVYLKVSTLINSGFIQASSLGLNLVSGYVENSGTLIGADTGAYVFTGRLVNSASISGGIYGVNLDSGELENTGSINAVTTGVYLYTGMLATSGAISGGKYAVYGKNAISISVSPGASFDGAVLDESGNGTLNFAAGAPATLAGIGTSITGFSTLNFAPGATWTLEGSTAALAAGQQITGFTNGSAIVLDNFTASALSLVNGNLVLYGGMAATLAIGDAIYAQNFSLSNSGGNSEIAFDAFGLSNPVGVITRTQISEVFVGGSIFSSNLSIASTGLINTAGYPFYTGAYLGAPGDTLTNAGTIEGAYFGVNLTAGTIDNTGSINGVFLTGVVQSSGYLKNTGVITGVDYGVLLAQNAVLYNSGTIYGPAYAINARNAYGMTLIAGPGAVFEGRVVVDAGLPNAQGVLSLAAGTGLLDIGDSFSGFPQIDFAAGATWTLEGSVSDLAHGQTITGFAGGDSLVLDGFAASGPNVIGTAGVTLSNGTVTETVNILGVANIPLIITTNGTNSTISAVAKTTLNTGTLSTTFLGATVNPGYTLVNSGAISAPGGFFSPTGGHFGGVGVFFSGAGGDLLNTGTVFGNGIGVELADGGTITNTGTIAASADNQAIVNIAGAFTLVADPGASFLGNVQDNAGSGVLILGGDTNGAINLTGFTGMPNITLAQGAAWSLTAMADGQTITGLTASDSLTISEFTGPAGLTLVGFAATASSYVPGCLVLSNAASSETISLAGSYTSASFSISTDAGSTVITDVACFCAGTRIATPRGNIRVENLNIGDLVKTTLGPRPIKWIGTRTYAGRFIANNPAALPIRIRRHAIAHNIPSRDLYVSPDHAICESGVLIHAQLLQNGVSITQLDSVDSVTYFHLELDSHAIIFAENLATESFIDESSAERFQNALTRPASAAQKPCLPRVHHGFHLHNIKSRLKARAGIPEPTTFGPLRGFIDEATPHLIRGWVQDTANPEAPVLLEIFSGPSDPKTTPEIFSSPFFNQNPPETFSRPFFSQNAPEIFSARILANAYRPDLRAAGIGSGCHAFSLPLPNLQTPITLRRAADGATLPTTPKTRAA